MVLYLCGSKDRKRTSIPKDDVYPAVLAIYTSNPACFESHRKQSLTDNFLKLLRADAIYFLWGDSQVVKKSLRNVDQLYVNGLDQGLIKRQFELIGPPLFFQVDIALNTMYTNLPSGLSTVVTRHRVWIITIIVLTLFDWGLTECTLVPVPSSKHP